MLGLVCISAAIIDKKTTGIAFSTAIICIFAII